MSAIQSIWGFDPLELLKKTTFPNDENEFKVRHSRAARRLAIQKLHDKTGGEVKLVKTSILAPGVQEMPEDEAALKKTSKIQREQLARSAAAITIQAYVRGWEARRRFVGIQNAFLSIKTHRDLQLADPNLPQTRDLRLQDRVLRKYKKYCLLFDKQNQLPPEYSSYCAVIIQATWKRYKIYQLFQRIKAKMHKKAASTNPLQPEETQKSEPIEEDAELKALLAVSEVKPVIDETLKEKAALTIQRAWKRYYNTRIYYFYRDLIKIRERGDPYEMFKFINPKESCIIDKSLELNIRFRLGGTQFPPTIYYKIYTHRALVDMNAFSPRNYASNEAKLPVPKQLFLKTGGDLPKVKPEDQWYTREEANDWRPVLDSMYVINSVKLVEKDRTKTKFHYSRLIRQQELLKKKKQRQIEWMRKLYQVHKHDERPDEQVPGKTPEAEPSGKPKVGWLDLEKGLTLEQEHISVKVLPKPAKTKVDKENLEMIIKEIEEMQNEPDLVHWTRALDFESYHSDWLRLATTMDQTMEPVPLIEKLNDVLPVNRPESSFHNSEIDNMTEDTQNIYLVQPSDI